jgi:hypothetical protein
MGGAVVVRRILPWGRLIGNQGRIVHMYAGMLLEHILGLFPRGGISNQEWYAFIFRISREESDSEIDTPFVNPHRTSHHVTCGFFVACCLDYLYFRDWGIVAFTFRNLPGVFRTPSSPEQRLLQVLIPEMCLRVCVHQHLWSSGYDVSLTR